MNISGQTNSPHSLPDGSKLSEAVNLMIDKKVSSIVVTRDERPHGVITHDDLLRIFARILQEPVDLKEKASTLLANPPLRTVLEELAAAGI